MVSHSSRVHRHGLIAKITLVNLLKTGEAQLPSGDYTLAMVSPRICGLLLLTTAPVAFAQRFRDSPEFIGNSYDIVSRTIHALNPFLSRLTSLQAEIAIWGIIFMSFLTLCFMAFINLITVRRRPYTFALLSLFLLTISSATTVTTLVLRNISPLDVPTHLPSSLSGLSNFFTVWGRLLIFVTVVVAMHDRLAALDIASGKQPTAGDVNRRRIFWALHGFFVLLLFALGTAWAGMITSLLHDVESGRITSSAELRRRVNTTNDLFYAHESFFVFAVFDVVALAIYLRGRLQKIIAKDQVCTHVRNCARFD